MKTLLASVLFASASVASASDALDGAKHLRPISGAKVVVNLPSRFTPVQPTQYVKFNYASCAMMSFGAETTETDDLFLVSIKLQNDVDCFGPTISREYSVQIASDVIKKPIVILNPVAVTEYLKADDMPRICTMIAGVVINKETGKCVGFSNGCQLSELRSAGFTHASQGECERVESSNL